MCGIVGVTGRQDAVEVLLHGLEKLEYRGYDSAGIYVNDLQGQDYLIKEQGKIAKLREKITSDVHGDAGIGHTRWATHGVPSEDNAHPHVSENGRFYLVHNGVIGNFAQLKAEYLSDVNFVSATDTEVIVQLVAYFAEKEGLDTLAAFKKVLSVVDHSSSYAFVLMDKTQPNTLFVAKNKSPLLVGVGPEFNVVCSDAMAVLNITHDFIELTDGDVVVITPQEVAIQDKNGEAVTRKHFTVDIDASASEKGAYEHYMLKEIDEQPAVMRALQQVYLNADGTVEIDDEMLTAIKNSERIYVVAAGTSYHAGLVGRELFEKIAQVPTEVHVASEFAYNPPLLAEKPFFIFLSQSGETADSREVLKRVNEWNYPSLTITNVPNSTLSREASYTMLLHAGPEIAVASTKAYTAQVAVEAILAKAIGQMKGLQKAIEFDLKKELTLVANAMQIMVDEKYNMEMLADEYLKTTRNAFYIGRGIDYDVAIEAALKLKEISYIQTEGFASGELKHGTIALIEEGTPVIAIITNELTAAHTRSNVQEVIARGANVIRIVMDSLSQDQDQIVIPEVHPLLTPLVSIIPAQLLAYYASKNRGYDVDKPRNLAKSVTVE
ncbi:glutamine--fructose-6-phosphate transaminase (isomerizing) [Ligilactobacillus ceti]|uniref:Glutamine--fructose-6-phosphate aminotransferase [isomerizing] n=1 Tax=Ligilactobacillus ceti DSM 22408 TaxID=1122146 RepID=A0A0R2KTJ0_9LACO|nr:glutamine--fructose-6-phosphate transaminase (isomerizing) [Ligilactobacillus ceti]KRN89994.1 D-fructose-6-phosphate amidotransferase [Ligilactobacillus ceti DSM 22408]